VPLNCWSEEWWQPGISETTIFGKGNCCIEDSTQFLINYLDAMPNERRKQSSVDDKQKSPLFCEDKHWSPSGTVDQQVWKSPTEPWFKLNTNDNYIEGSGPSGWGVVFKRRPCSGCNVSLGHNIDAAALNVLKLFQALRLWRLLLCTLIHKPSWVLTFRASLPNCSPLQSWSMISGTVRDRKLATQIYLALEGRL
jgi:hypothetical protein